MQLIMPWGGHGEDLKKMQWSSRVLLIFAPDGGDERVVKQRRLIEDQAAGFKERDLRVFVVTDEGMRARFHVAKGVYRVVLIGKDGTEKLRRDSVVGPEKIFELVDSMPMRRAERDRNKM